ncbi:MFS transporter [Desertifilum sp. FACHB-1129]|uniref:MFS transporter n=1 Tax=Desertifilum tharense IPPAS B-1220 TaxID=1781255 RepID=A0A1E5QGC6_9CYAN|nr:MULTISPECIES: MFS transporter [Desertifilum]MBD2314807.1 MFS transporter [Desertifilum sp. FACHB-1129]MBD2323194.1 MFS transporter [Desertifilum sp. FACHB-866]MBD2333039.1 MFS transporter [Desertifilum sp. FACHB-868]OEJ73634.1 MFS transporter [Desertifilum tharense IPPAS B-1220]
MFFQRFKHKRARPPASAAWIGIAIAFYAFIAIGIAESGLGVLLPSILETFDLTPATVTLLFVSQIAGYVLAAFSSSLISSRLGLAPMLLVATIALVSALVAYGLSAAWFVMVGFGTLLGLGIGLIDAGINTYMVSDRAEAKWVGLLHAFYGIGALLGPAIATTLLMVGLNWRQVYFAIASLVGLLILGVGWTIATRYTPMMVRTAASGTHALANLRFALQTPAVLISGLFLLVTVGTESSLGNWAYTVQQVSREVAPSTAGYSISAMWLGFAIGRMLLGAAIAWLGAIRLVNVSLTTLALGAVTWWLLPQQWLSLPLMGFAIAAIFPTTIWLMPQRVPAAVVPAAIGFVTSVASLGAALVPTAVGWIADGTGLETIPVLILLLAIALFIVHRWLTQQAKIQPVEDE